MHYAITIRTAHISLRNSDCKNFHNFGHWSCLVLSRDSNSGADLPSLGSQCGALLNLSFPKSVQHLSQLLSLDFLVYKVSVYTDSVKPHSKQCCRGGVTTFNTVLCLRDTIYGIESAPNSRHLVTYTSVLLKIRVLHYGTITYFWNKGIIRYLDI